METITPESFKDLTIPVKEKVHSELSQKDLTDTQNEFWNVDMEMRDMIKDMNVDQRKKVNGVIRKMQMGMMGEK